MRILLVTLEYAPATPCGGIGMFYRDWTQALRERGVDVAVVHERPESGEVRWERGETTVTLVPGRETSSFSPIDIIRRRRALARAVRQAAAEWPPDLVETHDWAGPLISKVARPLVVRLHGAYTPRRLLAGERSSRFWRLLESRTLALADAVVAVSHAAKRVVYDVFPVSAPWEVALNGVDAALFRPPARRTPSQEVLYVGSLRPDKGVGELFQALANVLSALPEARATLIGPAPNPAYVRSLYRLLPPALSPRVRCLGPLPRAELVAHYRRAAVCVFPSLFEAFGLACLEAMSCSAAVIGSRFGGAEEMIEDGVNGCLVDPRNTAALAASIRRALESPRLRATWGAAARRTVLERFSLDKVVERNLCIYDRLAASSRRASRWAA